MKIMSMTWEAVQSVATVLATAVSAAATVVLALLTRKYVRWTASMVNEMRQTREPAVFVDLTFIHGMDLVLVLGNSGLTPARNVRLKLVDRMPWTGPTQVSTLPVLREGLSYLAPSRVLKYRLGSVDWTKITEGEGVLEVTVTFENEAGAPSERSLSFDASGYTGVEISSFRDPLAELVDQVRDFAFNYNAQLMEKRIPDWFVKVCPSCGETIKRQAKKCPHCLERVEEASRPADQPGQSSSADAPEVDSPS
jgi:hypothetical protein